MELEGWDRTWMDPEFHQDGPKRSWERSAGTKPFSIPERGRIWDKHPSFPRG